MSVRGVGGGNKKGGATQWGLGKLAWETVRLCGEGGGQWGGATQYVWGGSSGVRRTLQQTNLTTALRSVALVPQHSVFS